MLPMEIPDRTRELLSRSHDCIAISRAVIAETPLELARTSEAIRESYAALSRSENELLRFCTLRAPLVRP